MRANLALCSALYLATAATGCSVIMAASGERTPDYAALELGQAKSKVRLLLGAPAESGDDEGGITHDYFRIERGDEPSGGRAAVYFFADIGTVFIWELIGTPIELSRGDIFWIWVWYDAGDRVIKFVDSDSDPTIKPPKRKPKELSRPWQNPGQVR